MGMICFYGLLYRDIHHQQLCVLPLMFLSYIPYNNTPCSKLHFHLTKPLSNGLYHTDFDIYRKFIHA